MRIDIFQLSSMSTIVTAAPPCAFVVSAIDCIQIGHCIVVITATVGLDKRYVVRVSILLECLFGVRNVGRVVSVDLEQ